MASTIFSQQDLYDLFQQTLEGLTNDLTDWNPGSINDSLAGVYSLGAVELQKLIIDRFNKTFFNLAQGPDENGGGSDDLQTLAVDHFGQDFVRPGATKAVGTITFTRPNTGAGNILIPAGTVVKTTADATGNVQRYSTILDVTMTGTAINASVQAIQSGSSGNAQASAVTVIESTLLDSSIIVSNSLAFSGGAETMTSPNYRSYIQNKLQSLKNGTLAAIEAAALNVPGVTTATGIETQQAVIPYNIATGGILGGGAWFYVAQAILYISDVNGSASNALIQEVVAAIASSRVAGVDVQVVGASPVTMNWTAAITLNPSGPNYSALSNSNALLTASMRNYINTLPIGTGFVRATADAAMLAIWGPSGTNDLSAFVTAVPSGSVGILANQKLVAGTVGTQ